MNMGRHKLIPDDVVDSLLRFFVSLFTAIMAEKKVTGY
jgi:hypothetical protein